MMDNKTADALITRIAGGDMSALEELYSALARPVFAFAASMVKNRSTAEDIMQETFVRVYKSADRFSCRGSGVSWIMRIARNLAMNHLARRRDTEDEQAVSYEAAPHDTESDAIFRIQLIEAVKTLSDSERETVILHAVSGLTLGEIAEITDSPIGTVKWRHAQALKKLRKVLSDEEVLL